MEPSGGLSLSTLRLIVRRAVEECAAEKGPLAVDPLSARIVERLRREATESPPPAQGKRPPAQAASEPETRAEGDSAAPARRELPSAATSTRAHATHAAAPRPQLESGDSSIYDRMIFFFFLLFYTSFVALGLKMEIVQQLGKLRKATESVAVKYQKTATEKGGGLFSEMQSSDLLKSGLDKRRGAVMPEDTTSTTNWGPDCTASWQS